MATLQERLARMRADALGQQDQSLTSRLERMRNDAIQQPAAAPSSATPLATSGAGLTRGDAKDETATPSAEQLIAREQELKKQFDQMMKDGAKGNYATPEQWEAYRNELNSVQAQLKDLGVPEYSVGKSVMGAIQKGIGGIAGAGGATAAFAEDVLFAPFELLSGQPLGSISDTGPLNRWNDDIKATNQRISDYYRQNMQRGGYAAGLGEGFGASTVQAVPQAVAALLTGGASAAAQTTAGLTQTAVTNLTPSVSNTVMNAIDAMAKNPMFWTSFVDVVGNGYESAIEDQRAAGATDETAIRTKAALYAVCNGLMNAAVEVGGGIEVLPDELRGGADAVEAWIDNMVDEGKEEVVQGIIERGLQAMYGKNNPIVSLDRDDKDAIFNPYTAAEEFAGGAVVGGILGGAEMGITSAIDWSANKAAQQTQEQGRVFTPPQTVQAQDGAPVATDGQSKSSPAEYRAVRPQNIELPNVPLIELSTNEIPGIDLDTPRSGNALRADAIGRARARLGLDENSAAYIPASNVTRNGDEYVLKITKASLNKMLSPADGGPVSVESIVVMDNLERIANNGVWFRSEGDRQGRAQIPGYDHLMTSVYIDGVPYSVDMRVRLVETRPGSGPDNVLYYFTPDELVEIKKVGAQAPTVERRALNIASEPAPTNNSIAQAAPESNTQNAPMPILSAAELEAERAQRNAERNGVNEQAAAAGGSPAGAGNAEAPVLDGGTGRAGGQRAGERSVRVPEEVRQKGGSRAQREIATRRQQAVQDAEIPLTSAAAADIRHGTETETMKFIPEANWDEELRQAAEWAYSNGIKTVKPFVGIAEVTMSGPDGTYTGQMLGVVDLETGTLYARADSMEQSFSETVEHEVAHLLADTSTVKTFREAVTTGYRQAGWGTVYDAYERAYRGATNDYAGMNAEEKSLYLWGEILGDAFSGKNKFGVAASLYMAEADAALGNTGEEGSSGQGQRMSVADETQADAEKERDDQMEQVLFRRVTPIQESREGTVSEPSGAGSRAASSAPLDRTAPSGSAPASSRTDSGIPDLFRPEGMSDEQYNALNQRYKEHRAKMEQMDKNTREQIMGRGSKRSFTGTEALEKVGVKVEGSVGIYSNVESLLANERAAQDVRKQTKAAERRLDPTEKEKSFAHGLAEGTYDAADIPDTVDRDKVLELADYYLAAGTFSERPLARQRKYIKELLGDQMRDLFKDSEQVKPSGSLVLNRRTPERNMLHIFGDVQGKAINEFIFDPVATNEAERYRWMTDMFDKVRTFEDSKGKKGKLNETERFLTQLALEGKNEAALLAGAESPGGVQQAARDIARGTSVDKAAKKYALNAQDAAKAAILSKWGKAQEALKAGKADTTKVENATKAYRAIYNDLYDAINDFLAAHGYQPIGFIKDYAPHFQSEDNMALLEKALKNLGVGADAGKLPASIAGQTADFKPGKRWDPHFLTRLGDSTEYDAAKGYEQYIEYISDIFYHTDDIAKVREASNYFRQTYSPEDIRDSMDWAAALRYGTADEKRNFLRNNKVVEQVEALSDSDVDRLMDEYVEKLLKDTKNTSKFSDLVMWLDNYANILAGKQSMADRGWEADFGRGSLNIGRKLMGIFGRAQVAGNISSALNQTAQIPQIAAEVGPLRCAHAIADAAAGRLFKASWIQESDFLVGKDGVDFLVTDPAEMVVSALFKPAELVDALTSAVAVRGKYLQEIRAGKTHQEAMQSADAFAKSVMGSRMKGSKPLGFHAKNPLAQAVNMFQVEALNSWEHISQDLPRDFRTIAREKGTKDAALALAGVIVKSLLGAFILNRLAEELYGGTPAPMDLGGISCNFVASGEGLTTNEWLRKVIDNGAEKLGWGRIFDTDPDEGNDDFDLKSAAEDTAYNVMNDVPYVRNLAGVLGLGDQSLPMPDLYGKGKALGEAVMDDGLLSADTGKAALDLLAQVIPGGRQLSKTAQGLEIVQRGGKYKGSGDKERLQYPIDEGWGDALLALLFGGNGLEEQRAFYAAGGKGLTAKQTDTYKTLTENGMPRKDAYDALKAQADLTPLEGNKAVTDQQKALDIAGLGLSNAATDAAVGSLLSGDQLSDYEAARRAGLDPETYLTWKLQIAVMQSTKDENGKDIKGETRKDKIVEAIDALDITKAQKDALYLTEYAESGLAKTPWR